MDSRVKEVVESALKANQSEFMGLEDFISKRVQGFIEGCYSKNQSSADRFAECIQEKNRKTQEIMKGVELKILFFSKIANQCLASNKGVPDCSQQVSQGLKEAIQGVKRNIERL